MWARVIGVIVAVVGALANIAFLSADPVWSTILVATDVRVVYALTGHGRKSHRGLKTPEGCPGRLKGRPVSGKPAQHRRTTVRLRGRRDGTTSPHPPMAAGDGAAGVPRGAIVLL